MCLGCAIRAKADLPYAGWAVGNVWDGYGTILRSSDSGNTWTRQGFGQIGNAGLAGISAVGPYTAWAVGEAVGGYGAIYHTTDGGTTWIRKGSENATDADYIPNVDLNKVHAVGNDVWIVGNEYNQTNSATTSVILHSPDAGATWTQHAPPGYGDHALQGVYTLDGSTVWATGGSRALPVAEHYGVVHKTTDGGENWTTHQVYVEAHDGGLSFLGISAADAGTAWAVGGLGYVLMKTTDGGANWTRQGQESGVGGLGDLNEVYAVSTLTVWVAADTGIYRTVDGGENWEDTGIPGPLAFMGISAVSDQQAWGAYVGQQNTGFICYTADGGESWTVTDQVGGEALPGLWNISFATEAIPEPSTLAMLSVAAALLLCRKRRGA